ncbi:MAG: BON domain-containing protein [Nitrospirae bacterium]|nr:BON domain-containing protein [Nitrospirota bacterium]
MNNSRCLRQKFILLSVLMVFGLALFSGCASMTGKTAGENIDDAAIITEANAIIVNDPDAKFLKIDVESEKGDVMLTGAVNSYETERRLVEKIRQIKGVKFVHTHLTVEGTK